MNIYSLKIDENKVNDGVWCQAFGAEFLIRRLKNKDAQSMLNKLLKPHKAAQRHGTLKDEVLTDIMVKVISETVLMDWKSVEDQKGKEIPFNPENAYKLLSEIEPLRETILEFAQDQDLFKVEFDKESEKN